MDIHFVEHGPVLLIKLTGAGELGSKEVDWIGAVNRKEKVELRDTVNNSTIEWVCA